MRSSSRLLSSLVLVAAVLLSACASKPGGTSASGETVAVERIAPAVTIPGAASRRLVLTMTGPDTVVQSKDWSEFKREWRETFAEHAKEAGIAFSFADTPPAPGQDGTLMAVNVADYRIVGIGARIMFGIMTGNAFIDAKARFTSLRDGAVYGEQQYNTSSSAAGGVFSKVTPQQVNQIAANVFMDLKAAKP